MKQLKSLILIVLFLLTADLFTAYAQRSVSAGDSQQTVSQVFVTFTFPSPTSDYSTYPDEKNKERYYVQFQISNLPSFKITPSTASVRPMVDNERSDNTFLVFWIPVLSGTSPRIDRNQSGLTLTFTPPPVSQGATLATERATQNAARPGTSSSSTSASSSLTASPSNAGSASQPAPAPAVSLQPQFQAENQTLPLANVDLSVPESPAFTVLGLTPETVVRPSSPRQFATALLNGVDRNGNFQSGTAIDTVPYLLLGGNQLTLRQYQDNYKLRLASRTQFSFATTKGASEDDKSVRLSLGLRLTLWDKGDPRNDQVLLGCFDTASRTYLQTLVKPSVLPLELLPPDAPEDVKNQSIREWAAYEQKEAQANPIRLEETEACRVEARKRNWNKSSWIVAYAPSWISTTGETKNFKWNGGGFWTSLAYGFEGFPGLEKHSQLILHSRYRSNEQVPDPDTEGAFFSQDSFFAGARLRVGNENSTGSFEGVFVRSRPDGKLFDTSARYSVGLERRIAENLWFALAFGGERGRADGANKGFVLTSFRWGFSEKRTIAPPQ